jgi:hypothetical protein
MMTKLPGMKKTLRRLILRNRNFRNIRPSRLFAYICIFMGFVTFTKTSCFVNFILRRSCELGLRKTWHHYGFITIRCLLVATRDACSKELIPNRVSPIFGSRLRLSFLLDASIFLPFSCFVRRGVLQVQLQVPRRFRRRSPLAQLPASSTLLMLVILPKTIVANPDMSSNFRFRFCAYQCNWCWTVLKFLCN